MEFGFVAAPFIALIVAILGVNLVFFVQQNLESVVEVLARSIITGQAQANDASGSSSGLSQQQLQARFKQSACARLPAFLSCAKLFVDVQSATDWSSINTTPPTLTFDSNGNVTNSFNYSLGGSGQITLVRVMYLWPVQTGPLGFNLSNVQGNRRLITATTVAKIENYTS